MATKFSNNASATLASSITNVATSIAVTPGQGALFPSLAAGEFFFGTLVDSSNNLEIVRVTARSTDTLTVTRAQNGTTARAYAAGDRIELRVVAACFDTFAQTDQAQTFSAVQTFNQTIVGSINGNAATVTNGVYTTGDQTIAGIKKFTSSMVIGGTGTADATLDIETTGANTITSLFTSGVSDPLFRLGCANGVSGSTTGTTMGRLGMFYMGSGESATIDFRRGGGATDGSFAFRTSGTDRATLDNSGNFTATGNVTAYSDERLKKDWAPVAVDFVSHLAQVKSGTYTRIDNDLRQAGVSAQSLQAVLPETVQEDVEGTLSVAYGNAALVAAIELAKEVVELKKRLEVLEAK